VIIAQVRVRGWVWIQRGVRFRGSRFWWRVGSGELGASVTEVYVDYSSVEFVCTYMICHRFFALVPPGGIELGEVATESIGPQYIYHPEPSREYGRLPMRPCFLIWSELIFKDCDFVKHLPPATSRSRQLVAADPVSPRSGRVGSGLCLSIKAQTLFFCFWTQTLSSDETILFLLTMQFFRFSFPLRVSCFHVS
jgi:hypothetical protein